MYSVTDEIFQTTVKQTVFGVSQNTFFDNRVFIVPVCVGITRRSNQTLNTMSLRKSLFGSLATGAVRTATMRADISRRINRRRRTAITTVTSQTTNTGRATVAIICSRGVATITVGYFYLLPSMEFLASSRAASSH